MWKGWEGNKLIFEGGPAIESDITIFALGGSSWKVTGSDGSWTKYFSEKEIEIIPFEASNCAYEIEWNKEFIASAEGKSLKNIAISCAGKSKKGELVITKFGLEGGAIYALSPKIRYELNENKKSVVYMDLKPHLTKEQIRDKLSARGNRSIKKLLIDRLSMDEVQIALLMGTLTKDEFTDPDLLTKKIKALPLTIVSSAPLDDAISTVGGIALNEIDENFQLKKLPLTYAIGEMLDWDAPTGGYLLQGCFSMGHYLAAHLNSK